MRYLFVVYGILFLVSCTTIPDIPICADLGTKGWCTYTIQSKEYFVEGDKWNEMKSQSLIMPADSWKEIKRYILNECKKHSDCFDEVGKWQRKTDIIDKNLGVAK